MNIFKNKITNSWFYTEMPWWGKLFLIYVRGDLFMLLPILGIIAVTSLLSVEVAVLIFGIFLAVRQLGELIYWLLQQFGDKKYRPYDFGFKNLDNNAIYILYQTFAIAGVVLGIFIAISSFNI
jgi:hypothetical protein